MTIKLMLISIIAAFTAVVSAQEKCPKDLDGGHVKCDQDIPAGCKWVDPQCKGQKTKSQGAGWKTPQDMSAWLAANFEYDKERARNAQPGMPIYGVEELLKEKKGVCFDVANASQEFLKSLGLDEAKVLKVEFVPCKIPCAPDKPNCKSPTMRLHWMASYKGPDGYYFMGDTRHIGRLFGPFESADQFMESCYKSIKTDRKVDKYEICESVKKGNCPSSPGGQRKPRTQPGAGETAQ